MAALTHNPCSSSDPEPNVDREQQRSITSAGLCRALRPSPLLLATPPSRSWGSYWLPGRAQSRQQPHGTDAYGQPLWRSCNGRRNQWLWAQCWSRPQVLQHRCAAYEGQGTQCSHLLGYMMSQASSTLPPYRLLLWSNHRRALRGRRAFFFLRARMITQVKWTGRDCEDNRGHCSGQHNQDNNCDCDNQQMLKVREIQRCDPEDVTQTTYSTTSPRSHWNMELVPTLTGYLPWKIFKNYNLQFRKYAPKSKYYILIYRSKRYFLSLTAHPAPGVLLL